jgi:hypothetical protein
LLQSNTNGGRAPQTSRAVAQQVDRAAYAIAWPTPDDAAVERKRRELDRLDPDRRISTIIVRRGWIIARGEIDDAESNEGWCRRRSEALARLAERTGGTVAPEAITAACDGPELGASATTTTAFSSRSWRI